jgi:pimeloyl-ACP methyl ester carboxylesterase
MPYIQVGDERLFYAVHRTMAGGELSMVLIHGAGGSHLVWPAQLRRLNNTTVYALDLPAHGKSEGQGRASVDGYASIVIGFLDALRIERAVLVGHSMGGAIVQRLALSCPARIAGLILIATGARLRVAPIFLSGLLADYETTLDTINRYAWGPGAPEPLIHLGRRYLAQTNAQVTQGDYTACDAFDVMEQLGQIAAPTLIISGAADQLTPAKYAARLAESIPGARLRLIENAGHMIMLEQPDQVAQAVSDFLCTLGAPHRA